MMTYDLGHEPRLDPPEDVPVFACDCCGETIYAGDRFLFIRGWRICEECIDDGMMTAEADMAEGVA